MRRRRKVILGIGATLLVGLGIGLAVVTRRPSLARYREHFARPAAPDAVMRAVFLGTSTILFRDGENAILIDGFFSRPPISRLALSTVAPDSAAITRSLERAGITRLDAIFVAHSHYDHAMDAPEVARRTGALLIGSESTLNVGRGADLDEARMAVFHEGEPYSFGRFEVTVIRSAHVPSALTAGEQVEIEAPLRPPVSAADYHEGGSYSLVIEHDGHRMLVQASAGYVEGALRDARADVVFLGVGLLGRQSAEYRDAYWREVVGASGARRVIVIHWDDFTRPNDEPLVPMMRWLDDFDASMSFVLERARREGIEVVVPVAWEPLDPLLRTAAAPSRAADR